MAEANFTWLVQIGPNLQGETVGVVNGTNATFFLEAAGGSQAAYSIDNGGSWNPIAPDQPVSASGGAIIQWAIDVPQGGDAKFLIGEIS